MNEILMIFLEKVCEALYFSLFIISGKKLKEKRMLFTVIMIFEYLLLTNVFHYSLWIHVFYFIMTYINLKVLYKEKSQITDIFLMAAASIILIILGCICAIPIAIFGVSYIIGLILNRILMFTILFFIKNKINNIYKKFYKNWNRNKNNKVRSLTLRNISLIIFNLMFYSLNAILLYTTISK